MKSHKFDSEATTGKRNIEMMKSSQARFKEPPIMVFNLDPFPDHLVVIHRQIHFS